MKPITEDYVSYEIAKLLKEKGFTQFTNMGYMEGILTNVSVFQVEHNPDRFEAYAYTHQMALKWLREVYDLHIIIYPWQADNEEKAIHWCCTVYRSFAHLGNDVYTNETPKSYEEAIEAALLYVLKNLI